MQKPFSQTAIGSFLQKNLPDVIGEVEKFVPAPISGGLDLVRNLIAKHPTLSPELKEQGLALCSEHEKMLIDDLSNARSREIEVSKATGQKDRTLLMLVVFAIGSFFLSVLYLLIFGFPKNLDSGTIAIISGFVTMLGVNLNNVYNYYFGSSASSKAKDETISKLS